MARSLYIPFVVFSFFLLPVTILSGQDHSLTQLTFSDSTHDGYPYWSPDGASILYSSGTGNSCFTMKIPAAGGVPEKITAGFAQHARWAPGGEYIVYDGDFGTMIQMIPAEGGVPVRIDPDSITIHKSGMPVWSPDGQKIAFKSQQTIFIMNLKNGALRPLFASEEKDAVPFDWSSDGSMILIDVRDTADRSQSDIWKVPLEGSPEQLTTLPGRQVKPSLSPDGSMILFVSDHGGNTDLWVLPSQGGDPVQLTFFAGDNSNPGFDVEGSWSPDGKSIAFSSTRSGSWAIWRMEPDLEYLRNQLFGNIRYSVTYPELDFVYPPFPTYLEDRGSWPSPAITPDGRELVLVREKGKRYIWFDATVENGNPLDYPNDLQGKGDQLKVDGKDFPYLESTGLHAEEELKQTKSITGLSISQITVNGRPGGASGAGFMAANETILSVLWSDNRMVSNMDLTHADLARPILQLWNISNIREKYNETVPAEKSVEHEAMVYNGKEVELKVEGSKGWQETIFNDEIRGKYHLEFHRPMDAEEESFFKEHYGHLSENASKKMVEKLTHIHTGEMVPYYINRYGFYEGHTDFRADPVAIAFIFGLRTIEEIHEASGRDLFKYLSTHFTVNP